MKTWDEIGGSEKSLIQSVLVLYKYLAVVGKGMSKKHREVEDECWRK